MILNVDVLGARVMYGVLSELDTTIIVLVDRRWGCLGVPSVIQETTKVDGFLGGVGSRDVLGLGR